jgi:RNA polymerase-binding transcription factor
MNKSIDPIAHYERLRKRRDQVMLTLEHVQRELRAVDDNKDWIDHAAYKRRVDLLDSLTDWYVKESAYIDTALDRIAEGKYGVCLACRGPIEGCLETSSEIAFCAECQSMREALG